MPSTTSDATPPFANGPSERKHKLRVIIEHLGHVLPAQAPILEFVHHNALHGFQHLPFDKAVIEAERVHGASASLPETEFRQLHRTGRISDEDLFEVIHQTSDLAPDEVLWRSGNRTIFHRDLYRIALVHGIEPLTPEYLRWSIEERQALNGIQSDVPPAARHALLESIKLHYGEAGLSATGQERFIRELWNACLIKLNLDPSSLHPEEWIDLSVQQAEGLLAECGSAGGEPAANGPVARRLMDEQARHALTTAFRLIGHGRSLRDLFLDLTGEDLLASVRPMLARYAGSFLDEGLAAWSPPERVRGFYRIWRDAVAHEWCPDPAGTPLQSGIAAPLPEDPEDAVIAELQWLGLAPEQWEAYLTRVALELPGWSGMMNWRTAHPDHPANAQSPAHLLDYLAVRLVLDRTWATRMSGAQWGIPADPPSLKGYFAHHVAEFSVRQALFRGTLPESLAAAAQQLVGESRKRRLGPAPWDHLADIIFSWHSGTGSLSARTRHAAHGSAWQLFRLAQHFGMTAPDVAALPPGEAEHLLTLLESLTPQRRAHLWLKAYERHYREEIFHALTANHGHGRWALRQERPEAQLVFCMDNREESLRRHIEELNPEIETLGASGFFGLALKWRALDDETAAAHCPIAPVPAHEVREVPASGQERAAHRRRRRLRFARFLGRLVNQELRRNLVSSHLLIDVLAPIRALGLIGKVLYAPRQPRWLQAVRSSWVIHVVTELNLSARDDDAAVTPECPRVGFSDAEQAERVGTFLRTIGLTDGFAPLVVMMGLGSSSQNNPHLAAYACSGRDGGHNARALAAMANRPAIRALLLSRQGIAIPNDTWFLGSEHNTCDETIRWFDTQNLPPILRPAFHKLKLDLDRARRLSAHERCRRFASAPRTLDPDQALQHVMGRAADFSQVRPELGHAAHAAAFIGRRAISRGGFFDRRVFLISYDPTRDPHGATLEAILLAVAPVGSGINLEYYFSTVDNERFGCGTKITHNVTGLFGVMEGTGSDLRTGLPHQMIELHEAMRLLVVVEQKPAILVAAFERHASLRQLIRNEWIQLASIDPDDGELAMYDPHRGFVRWMGGDSDVPVCRSSPDWYRGRSELLPPALIRPFANQPGASRSA